MEIKYPDGQVISSDLPNLDNLHSTFKARAQSHTGQSETPNFYAQTKVKPSHLSGHRCSN